MSPKTKTAEFNVSSALMKAFATNDRINAYLIRAIPDEVWRAAPPEGKGRTVAGMAAHIHNVRLMWLKANGAGEMPEKADGDELSREEAIAALAASCEALAKIIRPALEGDGRIRGFKPDAAGFLAYLFAHDAHHRGQMTMLARQLGHPVPKSAGFGMWEWGTR